ncbi:MAG: ATP-binding protein [Gallionella sp.]|nr:ATP-binding protein [Gallionella sp.]
MNLVNLFNPAHEHKFEVALFKLAQRNTNLEFIAPIVMPLVVYIAFGNTLDPKGFALWVFLLLGPFFMGIFVYSVLHAVDKNTEPSTAQLQKWRKIGTLYFFTAAMGWGGIGFLFDGIHGNQNNAIFVTYLAVVTIAGNIGGIHSFRMYYITVALSMLVIMATLPTAYGAEALPMSLIMAVYPFFLARISLNSQATILKMIELQIENEQLLKEKAAATQLAERERIYRDLHDDVGAKLLGLAISAQRSNQPRQADLARSALQDLRDVVSRSSHSVTRLDYLFADWRAETEQRVKAAGLDLAWHIPTTENTLPVNPAAALHLSRILREAISNVLRHAGASHIHVSLDRHEDRLILRIQDDGVGLPGTTLKANRGMNSMQARASMLGGGVTWESLSPRGCNVLIEIAIAHLTPDPASALAPA